MALLCVGLRRIYLEFDLEREGKTFKDFPISGSCVFTFNFTKRGKNRGKYSFLQVMTALECESTITSFYG